MVRFNDTPLLFEGDFNMTLDADDRPNGAKLTRSGFRGVLGFSIKGSITRDGTSGL